LLVGLEDELDARRLPDDPIRPEPDRCLDGSPLSSTFSMYFLGTIQAAPWPAVVIEEQESGHGRRA